MNISVDIESPSRRSSDKNPVLNGRIVPALDTASDYYLGVLYLRDDFRVAVSPAGRAYLCQSRDDAGVWNGPCYVSRTPLFLRVQADLEAAQAVAGLPESPADHFLSDNIAALLRLVRSVGNPQALAVSHVH